jgi:hypothetical protein
MTQPPNPFGDDPFGAPPPSFGAPPPFGAPSAGPPIYGAPPPAGHTPPPNTFATLSLIFAFIFAPAGAILGHVGLNQIRRTGQSGRDRALIGVALSYAVICAAVIALVAWSALSNNNSGRRLSAQPAQATTAPIVAPLPTSTVAPAALAGLLPTLDEAQAFPVFNGQAIQLLWDGSELTDWAIPPDSVVIKPARCYEAWDVGDSHSYDATALRGFHSKGIVAPKIVSAVASVAAYADAATATVAFRKLLADWQSCSASGFSYSDPKGGSRVGTWAVSAPADGGNGIKIVSVTAVTEMDGRVDRALAVKANVVIDVDTNAASATDNSSTTVAITNLILGKIPGPR